MSDIPDMRQSRKCSWCGSDASEGAACIFAEHEAALERAARVAAEGALAALRERITALAGEYEEDAVLPTLGTLWGRVAAEIRALLDSPDAGAKGEVR